MGKLKEKFVSGSAVFKIATKRDINDLRVKLYFTHCISFLGIVEHLSVHHLSDIFSDANPKTFSSGPYGMGKIAGFCHLYIGQEAVVTGVYAAITPQDQVITSYRDHAHPIFAGTDPKFIMAELFGKSTGVSRGKGGSMHIFDLEKNFFGGHGIVGGQIGTGAGLAFAERYRGTKNVVLCFFGDGAARQGMLHETFNMAMLWDLPVVFICENNHYAMGTSVARTSKTLDISKTADAYEMPSDVIDGMSPEAVHNGVLRAVNRAREKGGPTLLEIKTYRYKGHSMSDPQKYRTKEELEEYKEKDPIEHVLKVLTTEYQVSEADIEVINNRVKDQVEESVKFAEESPWPDNDELLKDVYIQQDYPYITD
jgi:pyruvate dehydrogenase E1 component alpha subunit